MQNFFLGIIVSGGLYWLLCKVSPVPACGERWCAEVDCDVVQGEVFSFDGEKIYGEDNKSGKQGGLVAAIAIDSYLNTDL